MDYAFAFIISNGGLHKEEDYPYLMKEGTCDEKKVTVLLYYIYTMEDFVCYVFINHYIYLFIRKNQR